MTSFASNRLQNVSAKHRNQLLILIGTLVGLTIAWVWFYRLDTYHFAVVQPGVLYRTGVRSTRELANTLRQIHPRTVVCLVTDEEVANPARGDFQGEFELLKEQGIRLVRVPMHTSTPPTKADVDRFVQVVTDRGNQPVLVHCAQGVVRTGMIVAAYEKRVLGYDHQQAVDAIETFGKGEDRFETVRAYVDSVYPAEGAGAEPSTRPVRQVSALNAQGG